MFDLLYCICLIVLLIISLVIIYVLENRCRKDKEEYISSLTEHDKAIILTYISKGRYFRRSNKNVNKEGN